MSRASKELRLPVRVQARCSRSEIVGVIDGSLRVRTTAPPVGGKANKDVIRQLAAAFGVPPARIRLKSGASHRNKVFLISEPRVLPGFLGAEFPDPEFPGGS